MKRKFLVLPLVAALAAGYVALARSLETERMAQPLPHAQRPQSAPRLDEAALAEDVRVLSSPAFEGRKTGTEGSRKAQALIAGRFAALGLANFGGSYLRPFAFTQHSIRGLLSPGGHYETRYDRAANVVGWIEGTRAPQRVMVISAHYDHLGIRGGKLHPGADDNASGVAALLAMAAWFRAHPPEHSIVFAAFDAEELGIRGADAFMQALPLPKERIALDINMDMIGHNDRHEIFAAGLHHYPRLRPLVEQAASRHPVRVLPGHDRPVLLTGFVEDWTRSSDHRSFHDAGIPFLYFGVDDHPDYHAPTDTFEHLNRAFLGEAAELILDVAIDADRQLDTLGG